MNFSKLLKKHLVMSTDNSTASSKINCLEELDTIFYSDIRHAKRIINQLKRPEDRDIGARLVARAEALNAESLEVKSNRNTFTKYLLRVLMKTHQTQPKEYDRWFKGGPSEVKETSMWSPDRRTFVSTKSIPGLGMLVYIAVTYQPELGWEENGFLSYKF